MLTYDPQAVAEYANDLDGKADWARLRFGLIYAFFGAVLSLMVMPALNEMFADSGIGMLRHWTMGKWSVLGCTLAGFILGWDAGASRASSLRLEAQNVLCQVEIERNTAGAPVAGESA